MRMKVGIILLFSSLSAFFSRVPERTFFLSAQKIIGRSKPFRICFSQTKTIWPRGTRYVSYLGQGIWVMFFEFRRRSSTFPKKRGRGRQGFIREKIYWGKHRACVILHAFFPSPALRVGFFMIQLPNMCCIFGSPNMNTRVRTFPHISQDK